jgi:4-diphosphocytidyl-2-C-methyl-D-erythritol kinase
MIEVAAHAKINLWLRVGEPDATGFHDLDTLFCALELADTVRVRPSPGGSGIRLRARAAPPLEAMPAMGPPAANLAVRAAREFLRLAGLAMDLEIRLVKRIPAGGGLGGGSSDAAAVLAGLDRLHPRALDPDQLADVARRLGSDVPFLHAGHALARGLGRGTVLSPVPVLPARPVLLVLPGVQVATAAAYAWLDQDRDQGLAPPPASLPLRTPGTLDWDRVADQAHNDFEPAVFRRHPDLTAYRDALRAHGAAPALLAGSGSTLFGVFQDEREARAAAGALAGLAPAPVTVLTRTRSR